MLRCAVILQAFLSASCQVNSAKGGKCEHNCPLVTPGVLDGQVMDMVWVGEEDPPKEVLTTTSAQKLYRSIDGGKTWEEKEEVPNVAWLMKSAADPKMLVAVCSNFRGEETRHITSDAGESWKVFEPKGAEGVQVSWMWMHPNQSGHILFSGTSKGCAHPDMYDSAGKLCYTELHITTDGGVSSKRVATHVQQFAWGPTNRIYYTHWTDKSKHQPRLRKWSPGLRLSYSDDNGKTSKDALEGANLFGLSGKFIFAAVYDKDDGGVSLMVSNDQTKTFEKAILSEKIVERSYMILDVTENRVILHVEKRDGAGNIYVSDESGILYSLSLKNNLHSNGFAAFQKMVNLRGVFIANIEDTENEHQDRDDWWWRWSGDNTQSQSDRAYTSRRLLGTDFDPVVRLSGAPEPASLRGNAATMEGLEDQQKKDGSAERRRLWARNQVRSLISFNMGGSWQGLRPPEKDADGKVIECAQRGACSLHLHDITEYSVNIPVYSFKNAVGIIMGTGNVGSQLNYDTTQVNTYLSNDGGMTWRQVSKGPYIYEYGNHGGILVMADWRNRTDKLWYSWDLGQTWDYVVFTTNGQTVRVKNVITELHALSLQFVILGVEYDGAKTNGKVFHVDFNQMHTRVKECKKLDKPGEDDSDYEHWYPPTTKGEDGFGRCILGSQVEYTRRKPKSICYNSKTLEVYHREKQRCICSREDYECEAFFEPDVHGNCVPMETGKSVMENNCGDAQKVKNAYRKIPGDVCYGGKVPDRIIKANCAKSSKPAGSLLWTVLKWGSIIVCSIGLVVACCKPLRNKVRDLAGDSFHFQTMGDIPGMGIGPVRR